MALLPGGGQAQYVTVPEELLMPIPEGLTLLQAAAIPEAWLTAFQLLHLVGEEPPRPFTQCKACAGPQHLALLYHQQRQVLEACENGLM